MDAGEKAIGVTVVGAKRNSPEGACLGQIIALDQANHGYTLRHIDSGPWKRDYSPQRFLRGEDLWVWSTRRRATARYR